MLRIGIVYRLLNYYEAALATRQTSHYDIDTFSILRLMRAVYVHNNILLFSYVSRWRTEIQNVTLATRYNCR